MKNKIQAAILILLAILLVAAIWGGFSNIEEKYSGKIIEKEIKANTAYRMGNESMAFNRKLAAELNAQKALTAAANDKYEKLLKKRPKKQKLPAVCANVGGAVVSDRVLHQMCKRMRSQLLLIGNMEKSEVALIEVNASLEKENKTLELTAKNFETAAIKFDKAYRLQVNITGMKVRREKRKHKGYFIAGVLLGTAVYALIGK